MLRSALWFFLCDQGEDMRRWDGEPTFKLEAYVCKLRGKKGPSKKAVSVVAAETQKSHQRSARQKNRNHLL